MRRDAVIFATLLCFRWFPGQSWGRTASAATFRGWSSATAGRGWVSPGHLTAERSIACSRSNFTLLYFCSAGVKIIGGYRELTGEDFGIYIKRVVCGGLAALDGTADNRRQPSGSLTD